MKAKHPFLVFNVYKVMSSQEDRWIACLKNRQTGKRSSMSWARYLMSVSLGRELLKTEHVDHIDRNSYNDNLSNLQILTQKENRERERKSIKERICWVCKKTFTPKRHYNYKPILNCSRRCGGKASHML